MHNVVPKSILLREVTQVFSLVENVSSRLEITRLLADLLKNVDEHDAQKIMYFVLGTLNPPYISTQFSIAQKTILKAIARLAGISEIEITEIYTKVGDIGLVLEHVQWQSNTSISLQGIYQELQALEALEGAGSQEEKIKMLVDILQKLDSLSAKYVVRIIVGTLRLGCSDMTLLDALSWMAIGDKSLHTDLENAYTVCADLGLIAYTLKKSGIQAIKDMHIVVGIPIRPAAAERLENAAAIIEKIGPCVVQPKLDGFRLQIHVDLTQKEPVIRFFSRNLLDMSLMFPELVHVCKIFPVKSFIADGEAIVHDPETGAFLPFQTTVKRKRKHAIDQAVVDLPLQLYLFDLLYLDGQSLLGVQQQERRKLLENLFTRYCVTHRDPIIADHKEHSQQQYSIFDTPDSAYQQLEKATAHVFIDTCKVIEEEHVKTAQELEHYFLKTITDGLEGIVAKKPDSLYQAGKRNFNWIKLKYQVASKLNDSIDVVILGYYPGKGKRAAFGIGAFLVGVYNKDLDQFETVAKIGTGLTDQAWISIKELCDAHKVLQQPLNVVCAKELYPMVWVAPHIVCEVLADEVTISPLHTAGKGSDVLGFALRFPRFLKQRFDKDIYQTTSISELASMHKRL